VTIVVPLLIRLAHTFAPLGLHKKWAAQNFGPPKQAFLAKTSC
jgi:hypothetical protein